MKLKEIFTNLYFTKGVKITEYTVLGITAFCGIFWALGFYYLGILLGIVSLLLIVAKICIAKYEAERYFCINQKIEAQFSENEEERGMESRNDLNESIAEDEHEADDPKYTLVSDDFNEEDEDAVETIPQGVFDSAVKDSTENGTKSDEPEYFFDADDMEDTDNVGIVTAVAENVEPVEETEAAEDRLKWLEKEFTPHGKELLNEWIKKYSEYEKMLESNSDTQMLEEELDKISDEIILERKKFLEEKEEQEESLRKAKLEENKKRLAAQRAKLGL